MTLFVIVELNVTDNCSKELAVERLQEVVQRIANEDRQDEGVLTARVVSIRATPD